MTYRKLRSVDIDLLRSDLNGTSLIANDTNLDISSLIENYESTLSELLKTHAPEKRRIITLMPHAPWYNDSINVEKRKCRKLERQWQTTRLCIDRELYMSQCTLVNQMIKDAKSDYYSKIITAKRSNQRVLFNTVDRLLHRRTEQRYPAAVSKDQLVNDYVAFFDTVYWVWLCYKSATRCHLLQCGIFRVSNYRYVQMM